MSALSPQHVREAMDAQVLQVDTLRRQLATQEQGLGKSRRESINDEDLEHIDTHEKLESFEQAR